MRRYNKENFRLFLKFAKYLLPYWKKELFIIILGELAVLFSLAYPYLSKLLIDRGILQKDLNFFILVVLAMIVQFLLTGIMNAFVHYFSSYINSKVNLDLVQDLCNHLSKLSFSFFQSKSSGEQVYKVGYDTDRITDFITSVISESLTILPRTVFIFAIIFYLDRRMAILSLCLAPLLYVLPYYFMKRMKPIFEEYLRCSQEIFGKLTELFSHMHLVKAFGKETREFKDYIRRAASILGLSLKNTKIATSSDFSGNAISRVVIGIIFFYGGYQVILGRLSFGSVTAIMLYISQLFALQSKFAAFFQKAASGMISCQRIEEILSQKVYQEPQDARAVTFHKGEIIFNNVSFAYPNKSPILEKMNFKITGAAHIALVGPSGCGKTTTINLILRLFSPQKGEISIDGNDLKEIKSDFIYQQIGVVLQEPFLWNDTIENNIKYGREDASLEQIIEVAKLVGIDDFVNTLPDGYRTRIGENATLISQGQKQRLAIARAIIKNPKILILDEAMSSLDSESETKIIDNIRTRFAHSTVVIVSHRLSAAKKMDSLYFLRSPDKMEIGSYEEILKRNTRFKEIFAEQLEPQSSLEL
jgi:ABC-type multidrug transport system fused ATPase/permease subunit